MNGGYFVHFLNFLHEVRDSITETRCPRGGLGKAQPRLNGRSGVIARTNNSLAETGAAHIICRNLGDCPTGDAAPTSFGTRGVAGSNPATPTSFLRINSFAGNDMGNETH
jgi:hypothetical protein